MHIDPYIDQCTDMLKHINLSILPTRNKLVPTFHSGLDPHRYISQILKVTIISKLKKLFQVVLIYNSQAHWNVPNYNQVTVFMPIISLK